MVTILNDSIVKFPDQMIDECIDKHNKVIDGEHRHFVAVIMRWLGFSSSSLKKDEVERHCTMIKVLRIVKNHRETVANLYDRSLKRFILDKEYLVIPGVKDRKTMNAVCDTFGHLAMASPGYKLFECLGVWNSIIPR